MSARDMLTVWQAYAGYGSSDGGMLDRLCDADAHTIETRYRCGHCGKLDCPDLMVHLLGRDVPEYEGEGE